MKRHRTWHFLASLTVAVAVWQSGTTQAGDHAASAPAAPQAGASATATGVAVPTVFDGIDMFDARLESGALAVPANPMSAAGVDRIVSVVGHVIEAFDRSGTLLWRESLAEFFGAGLGTLGTPGFGARVLYDPYEDRFVVMAYELLYDYFGDPVNDSRLLLAVSRGSAPPTSGPADWYFAAIHSAIEIDGRGYFASHVRFELDEHVLYLAADMFTFELYDGTYASRLWIVDKGVAGGFYGGGPAGIQIHAPWAGAGIGTELGSTTPALILDGGPAPTVGTFLLKYGISRIADGVELLDVIRVDNPLGPASFTRSQVELGDIDAMFPFEGGSSFCVDPPQPGTTNSIRLFTHGCRTVMDAVWRDDALWFTVVFRPKFGPNVGRTTAHWFKLDTSLVPDGPITVAEKGFINADDQAPGASTYVPSVAVNGAGDAKFGFAASAPTLPVGAFVTGRRAGDPPGALRPNEVVRAGGGIFERFNEMWGPNADEWGIAQGIGVDPVDDDFFWVGSTYTKPDVTPGRGAGDWGSVHARCGFFEPPPLPDPSVVPGGLDFGPVPFSAGAAIRVLRIQNNGGADLFFQGISGPSGDFFLASQQPVDPLVSFAFIDVEVGFAPSNTGAQSSSLTIFTSGGELTVPVTGEGVFLGPPSVSDGSAGPPLLVDRLDTLGFSLELSYDSSNCQAVNHNVIFGTGATLPPALGTPFGVLGGECGIGTQPPYTWLQSPDPGQDPSGLLWFLVVATNGQSTEGPWGHGSDHGQRFAANSNDGASQVCQMTARNLSNTCGQGEFGGPPIIQHQGTLVFGTPDFSP